MAYRATHGQTVDRSSSSSQPEACDRHAKGHCCAILKLQRRIRWLAATGPVTFRFATGRTQQHCHTAIQRALQNHQIPTRNTSVPVRCTYSRNTLNARQIGADAPRRAHKLRPEGRSATALASLTWRWGACTMSWSRWTCRGRPTRSRCPWALRTSSTAPWRMACSEHLGVSTLRCSYHSIAVRVGGAGVGRVASAQARDRRGRGRVVLGRPGSCWQIRCHNPQETNGSSMDFNPVGLLRHHACRSQVLRAALRQAQGAVCSGAGGAHWERRGGEGAAGRGTGRGRQFTMVLVGAMKATCALGAPLRLGGGGAGKLRFGRGGNQMTVVQEHGRCAWALCAGCTCLWVCRLLRCAIGKHQSASPASVNGCPAGKRCAPICTSAFVWDRTRTQPHRVWPPPPPHRQTPLLPP